MNASLEDWYANLPDGTRTIAGELRQLVLSEGPALREVIKWNQPCFYGQDMVCYLQKAKGHVSLGFRNGSRLADPDGLLEGSGRLMRHVKIPSRASLNREALARLLQDAIALDRKS